MPDRTTKAKAKARANENGVLGALPHSRPDRLGGPRHTGSERRRARAAKPRAVRAAAPELEPRHAVHPPPEPLGAPKGTELVTTAIRATGELAQIGFVVGGKVLKRTLDRLPRPR
ncbi:hypothetical protein DVA67_024415 [Solirubrobacter sp. CPCC 204708]|uniref:Uncharacterized protein n=1 Tax=Solirubrobacter deserti TaxID=2282478 RepID=A0ABT4RKY6_9ACTN|nr:hypothetical protein [Solirubrobacter deserti]MBE2319142.1 hypothetical protein [Solirubrobacter deserti]MDA0139218.1 hypothetical protein [Solirubrobacter deserti]